MGLFSKKKKAVVDVMLHPKDDRRKGVQYIPDPERVRGSGDRRGESIEDEGRDVSRKNPGQRYVASFPVDVRVKRDKRSYRLAASSVDISQTGILIEFKNERDFDMAKVGGNCHLKFKIPPGAMREGLESRVKMDAKIVRSIDGRLQCGVMFNLPLSEYIYKTKDRYALGGASLMMLLIAFFIVLMRAESIIYFRFNKVLYLYSIVTALFLLSRYLFGALYKAVPLDPTFTPGVTIIIPCFNEEEWIDRTIISCLNQDYPTEKLEILVVDDCSTDRSLEVIHATLKEIYSNGDRYRVRERVRVLVHDRNKGKRDALAWGAQVARHELIVFVDSDSFLEPDAIKNIVQPFRDPKMAGVSGRTDVANTYTNMVTKMQAVRYYTAFRIMKAAEAYFDGVSCLSGPLSCYKKSIVMEHLDDWLNQQFLGQRATFGDDRSLTNFILRKNRTFYQDTAICSTIVPNSHKVFLKQQMRWKRSWLRESFIAATYIWRKEPILALTFYMGFIVPILAPIVVIYNLFYIPFLYKVFPTTFIVGILMMSMIMSFAQLFFRKSSIWMYGMLFCLYYECVLLWQMPVAWVTYWKNTWGTRMTPEDVAANERKKARGKSKSPKGGGNQGGTPDQAYSTRSGSGSSGII